MVIGIHDEEVKSEKLNLGTSRYYGSRALAEILVIQTLGVFGGGGVLP